MIDTKEWRNSMSWLQIDNLIETSARDIYMLLDEIDRLRDEAKAARLEGWSSAKNQTKYSINEFYDNTFDGHDLATAIESMQPPAEWSEE